MTSATPATTTTTASSSSSTRLELDEDLHYTVLYGYGIVPPHKRQSLGAITGSLEFIGGVRRDVPGRIARLWRDGGWMADGELLFESGPEVRRLYPTARRIAPLRNLHVLPNTATEADYLRAIHGTTPEGELTAALREATPAQTGAVMKALSAASIVEALGREDARLLAEAICDELGLRVVSTFSGGGPATGAAEAQRSAARARPNR